jgi:hypothetical protein
MPLTKYSQDHLRVKETIEQIMKETDSKCVIVTGLAKELDMDSRTLRKHLEVMEIDAYGYFPDSKTKKLFCRMKK